MNADLFTTKWPVARSEYWTFDFAFLTVDQLHLLRDDTVDVAIECHSFQEMTRGQTHSSRCGSDAR
jgi:hypothetical protein